VTFWQAVPPISPSRYPGHRNVTQIITCVHMVVAGVEVLVEVVYDGLGAGTGGGLNRQGGLGRGGLRRGRLA
jgi:hypothetical protein